MKTPVYKVRLDSAGNPDHGQDPRRPLYGAERAKWVAITSLEDASRICREFIERNELGRGDWKGGIITKDGVPVARVSYNGRVWLGITYSKDSVELTELP